jgi:glycerol 3-phosphatase-2
VLGTCDEPLSHAYDLAMLDLDGVVYVGQESMPGAATAIAAARAAGQRIAFITNNASRSPEKVAERIERAGVPAGAEDVVTSAQAAARVLCETYGAGARIVALGGSGLREALTAVGLVPVGVEDDGVALATGYGPDVVWRDVMRAAVRLRDGLPWVASNTDGTIPTSFGVAPGHGVLVRMLADFSGARPVVAGKPARPLLDETIRRTGARRPLMVGDRLDTDIEGATNAGIPSLLVMTGVTGLADLVAAPPRKRPTYLSADLRGLLEAHEAPTGDGRRWRAGGWTAQVADGRLAVTGGGAPSDWWRVVAAASWAEADETRDLPDLAGVRPPAAGAGTGTLPA